MEDIEMFVAYWLVVNQVFGFFMIGVTEKLDATCVTEDKADDPWRRLRESLLPAKGRHWLLRLVVLSVSYVFGSILIWTFVLPWVWHQRRHVRLRADASHGAPAAQSVL